MTSVRSRDPTRNFRSTCAYVNRQFQNEDSEKRREWDLMEEWIDENIKMRYCSHYIASTHSEGLCQCGYRREDHDLVAFNRLKEEKSQQDLKWNFEQHSDIVGTNAFGEIEFVGFIGHTAKFVRVDSKTEIATMLELMIDVWKIERPNLLISVIGDTENFNFNMTPRLRDLSRFGLVNAARKLDAWIITGGTHVDVAKHVGDAVQYSSRLKSENQKEVVVIGIAPWGVIHNKGLLEYKKREPIQYTIEDKPIEQERFLNPNHSHYILVDNGTQHQFETDTTLRVELECNTCSKYDFKSIPVVLLVIDGGPHILKRVKNALLKNIPVVIVKGSGRVADLLAYSFKNAEESESVCKAYKGNAIKKTTKRLTNSQRQYIYNKMTSTKFCETDDIDYNINEIEACLDKFELINIFELGDGDEDLYNTMLNAVLKANESSLVELLSIALTLNLIDFARSVILNADKGWEVGSLDDIMVSAIQSNKVEFVELLLDNAVKIERFLTSKRLLELYNGELSFDSTFPYLLQNMRKKNKKTSTEKISMKHVGQVITHLLDEYYLQQYSSNPDLPDDAPFENPFLHLLIWAVLNNLQDMATLFWRKGLDSIAAALLAHALFSAMSSQLKKASPILYEGIKANSREFMDLATGVVDQCYRIEEERTIILLTQDLVQWNDAVCILIAIKANNKTFMTTTAFHEVSNTMWMGKMTQDNGFLKLLICMFIPPLILLCVKFKKTIRDPRHENRQIRSEMSLKDEDGQSSVETEMSQSGPSSKDSGDEKQGIHEDSAVPIIDEVEQPFIERTFRQIGQEIEEAGVSSPLQPRSQLHKTNHGDEIIKYSRPPKEKITCFYQAPVVNFLSHVISYMAFLCLYSYVLISKFDQNFSVEDVILIVCVFNIFLDEIHQVIATRHTYTEIKLKAYLADFWNIADILMILLFLVGMILKHLSYQETLEAARVVLGVNLIIGFVRLLQMFSLNKELGPKLVMIIRMVRNLTSFFVILLIFIVGYAIASHAILYPNTEITFNALRIIFRRPYWNIYGDLMLDEIEGNNDCTNIVELYRNGTQPRCPTESGKYVVPVLMGVYMLMCNILLLNLLISIFSNTYQMVQEKADKHWRVQRYRQIQDYFSRPMYLPFFSFILDIFHIIVFLKEHLRRSKPENTTSKKKAFLQHKVRKWERKIAQDFYNSRKANLKGIDHSVKANTLRLDQLVSKIDALQEQQHTGTANIEDARLYRSHTEYSAKSKSSTVDEPSSVSLDQRMDNIEKQLQWIVDRLNKHEPGAVEASPEKTDEIPGFSETRFPLCYNGSLTGLRHINEESR